MTNEEIVSTVTNASLNISSDLYLTRSFVFSIIKAARSIVAKKYKLEKDDSMEVFMECFELEEDNVKDCGIVSFRRCKNLMKSKLELPKVVGSWKSNIISVQGIDSDNFTTYYFSDLSSIKKRSNRKYGNIMNEKYFYVHNNYLYIPDSEVKLVDILMIPEDEFDAKKCSSCTDNQCFRLDSEFKSNEDYLAEIISLSVSMVTNKFRLNDEQPDLTAGGERPQK